MIYGQTQYRNKVRSMFDVTDGGLWISEYEGLFDDSYPVSLTLGTSGSQCRGIITYRDSKTTFHLEGEKIGDKITLEEFDDDNQHTATVNLSALKANLSGQWIGINGKKTYNITLDKKSKAIPSKEKVLFYNKTYSNNDNSIRLSIVKSLYDVKVDLKIEDEKLNWTAYLAYDSSQGLKITNNNSVYSFIPLNGKKLLIRIVKGDETINYHVELDSYIPFESFSRIDYTSKGEAYYPITEDEKYNSWMKATISKIWENQLTISEEDSNSPYKRFDDELYIRTIITAFSDKIISGLILVENKSSSNVHTVPFSYSFKKHQQISISDIFKKEKQELLFQKYKNIEYQQTKLLPDGLKKQWLLDCDYKNVVLTYDGIALYSSYNIVFGNHHILIPYQDVRKQLKYIPIEYKN